MAEATLPKLAHLGEVIVRPVEDPARTTKTGMIHLSRTHNGSYQELFASLDGVFSHAKPRIVPDLDALNQSLHELGAFDQSAIEDLLKSGHSSQFARPTLKALYLQGLV